MGSQYHPFVKIEKARGESASADLRLGQKLVFVDHGGHRHFTARGAVVEAHNRTFASNPNALGEGYLGRESQSELNRGPGGDRRIHVKRNASCADITRL